MWLTLCVLQRVWERLGLENRRRPWGCQEAVGRECQAGRTGRLGSLHSARQLKIFLYVCIDNTRQLKIHLNVCIDNTRQLKIHLNICIDNTTKLKIYLNISIDNTRHLKIYLNVCIYNNRKLKIYLYLQQTTQDIFVSTTTDNWSCIWTLVTTVLDNWRFI